MSCSVQWETEPEAPYSIINIHKAGTLILSLLYFYVLKYYCTFVFNNILDCNFNDQESN